MINKEQMTSYIDAMVEASEIIKKENPDCLIVPLLGSVPFIDSMNIVSNDFSNFDSSKVFYLPASSRIQDVNKIIRSWYFNFLKDKVSFPDYFPKIMGIDEVVSGQSVLRSFKEINIATNNFKKEIRQNLIEELFSKNNPRALNAIRQVDIFTDNNYSPKFFKIKERLERGDYLNNESLVKEDFKFFVDTLKKNLEDKFNYSTIGIEDSKKEGKRNLEYELLKEQERVFPVKVEFILTMDDPNYCPPKFKELESSKKEYIKFSPKIEEFVITEKYIDFLRTLAKYVGKDYHKVSPVNFERIFNSSKYLDAEFNKE